MCGRHSAVAAVLLMVGLFTALASGRPVGSELVAITKLLAVYAAVVAAVKLRDEWVEKALAWAAVGVLSLAVAALGRGEWWQAAILAVAVVLAGRLYNSAAR
jgi:hypothetical protein